MAKHSKYEREMRAQQAEKVRQLESAWVAALPADGMKAHTRDVDAARARGPLPPPPNQAPGTLPHPPRPGREPKPVKDDERPRRRSY